MTFVDILIIGIGGFLGAITRYLLSLKLNHARKIPVGTLIVNLTGSLLIGIVFGLDLSRMWTLFFASGLAGALTTFSTMNKELLGLWKSGEKKAAISYLVITYVGGILLAAIGYGFVGNH
ncbi:CrcB family protein [Filibacter tadaridae]|uniref:Fluoride-specific ion channel FluC n=1 Tax=Filibacter tadaridae TaxID=2483811 RepID=A0A3P5WV11_9BACL|nr:CrcB family protein [Filibacter tadaridae]VDC25518.1 Putative fluoride ion transporter CrcB [Filibacter tadaridae]